MSVRKRDTTDADNDDDDDDVEICREISSICLEIQFFVAMLRVTAECDIVAKGADRSKFEHW